MKARCPHCNTEFGTPDETAGKQVRCAHCGKEFQLTVAPTMPPVSDADATILQRQQPITSNQQPPTAAGRSYSSEDSVPPVWNVGDVILGLYEVKHVHDTGGLGLVYRVRHRNWNTDLAVKTPRPQFFQTERHKELFERECETWVNLGLHPHTVSCYYVRRLGGIPRVFAEYVEGGSLRDWIRNGKLYEGGSGKALERILDVVIQFAWGLHYAHEKELVHQDVKPANVMMASDGTAKVTDFGLARASAESGEARADLTDDQSLLVSMGGMTPAYASPEQMAGEKLSRKTDIWSWAVSVLEMFTGKVTWKKGSEAPTALDLYLWSSAGGGGTPSVPGGGDVPRNPTGPPPPSGPPGSGGPPPPDPSSKPHMPGGLSEILKRCFQGDPRHRPSDLLEIVVKLQSLFLETTGRPYPRVMPKSAEATADILNNHAISLLDLGQPDRAEELLPRALQKHSGHFEATFNLGLLRWRRGKQTDTEFLETLRAAAFGSVDSLAWAQLRGYVHLERGDAEDAVKELREATKRPNCGANVWKGLGLALLSMGKIEEGKQALREAIRLGATDAETTTLLSDGNEQALIELASRRSYCDHTLHRANDRLVSIAISPDGHRLAIGNNKDECCLWEFPKEKLVQVLRGPQGAFDLLAFSGNGDQFISCSRDGVVRYWETSTARMLRTFRSSIRNPVCFEVDAAGSRVFLVDNSKSVLVMPSGEERLGLTLGTHFKRVMGALLSGSGEERLRGDKEIWNCRTGVFLNHNGRLLTASGDELVFFNAQNGKDEVQTKLPAPRLDRLATSPEENFVLFGTEDGSIGLWEIETGDCRILRTRLGSFTAVALFHDGNHAVSVSKADRALRLWNLNTGKCMEPQASRGIKANVLLASRDTQIVATVSDTGVVYIWHLSAKGLSSAPFLVCRPQSVVQVVEHERVHHERLQAARKALNANDLARAYQEVRQAMTVPGFQHSDDAVQLLHRLRKIGRRSELRGVLHRTVISSDGQGVQALAVASGLSIGVSGGPGDKLRLWDLRTGECLKTFRPYGGQITAVALSSDGLDCVVGYSSGLVREFDAKTEKLRASCEGHGSPISVLVKCPAIVFTN